MMKSKLNIGLIIILIVNFILFNVLYCKGRIDGYKKGYEQALATFPGDCPSIKETHFLDCNHIFVDEKVDWLREFKKNIKLDKTGQLRGATGCLAIAPCE